MYVCINRLEHHIIRKIRGELKPIHIYIYIYIYIYTFTIYIVIVCLMSA